MDSPAGLLPSGTMRILLVSTYELGHQPLHVAAPAAELHRAGHDVRTVDLSVDPWDPSLLEGVDAVAVSVPMHTAMRLAIETGRRIKERRPGIPLAFYGLYAHVGAERDDGPADRLISGEYEDALVAWVGEVATSGPHPNRVTVEIGRREFVTPVRDGLPPLERYARLETAAGRHVVGYVEASHGCRHRCAHCPIPVVYDGRYRITGVETVLADIEQQVQAGARHITFGDPDFLNAPPYALGVIEQAHSRHPEVTFDVTVKVEHILARSDVWPRLAEAGVVFVVSAIESLDDDVLARLDKGHTAADADEAVDVVGGAGIDLHPTWLPFTPWTSPDTVADIAEFIWRHDLAPVTDPVQLSIRLLIPDGSLMLDVEGIEPFLTGYDAAALGHTWKAADPAMDDLQEKLARIAEDGAGDDPVEVLRSMTTIIMEAAGRPTPDMTIRSRPRRPRLTEPWFCCAEPTVSQLDLLG